MNKFFSVSNPVFRWSVLCIILIVLTYVMYSRDRYQFHNNMALIIDTRTGKCSSFAEAKRIWTSGHNANRNLPTIDELNSSLREPQSIEEANAMLRAKKR